MGRSIRYRTHDSFDDQAGVAAVHIEDQVGTKRCGRRPGKELVPTGEMVDRIKAGCGRSLAIDRAIWNLRCICLEGSMPTRQQGRNHMRVKLCVMTTAAFAFAFASACFAEQVKTDWDRSANFGQYRSYSWERVSTRDPLMVDRIKSAVNAVLASKGGQKCHPARALLSSQSKQRTIST